ncbi:MAG: TlpA disulfide reductase family protein [Solirubrobacterales bacterium]
MKRLWRAAPRARWVAVAVLVVGVIVVVEVASGSGSGSDDRQAPPLPTKALQEPAVDLASLRGKPALIDFFASWCDPCAEEAPTLRKLSEAIGDKATIVAVDWDDAGGAARAFVRRHGLEVPRPRRHLRRGRGTVRAGRPADLLRDQPGGRDSRHLPRSADRGKAAPGAPRSRLSTPLRAA